MPKRTKFAILLDDATAAIEHRTSTGSGQHLKRLPLLRELLEWVVLRNEAERVTSIAHGMKSRFTAMLDYRNRVASAVHGIQQHRASPNAAASLFFIKPSDIHATSALAKAAKVSLGDLDRVSDDEGIRAYVEYHFEKLIVGLEQSAVEDLLLAGLEAYEVPKPGRGQRYTEAYGYCFGTRRDLPRDDRTRKFFRVINVARVVTQIRSRASASEVYPNSKSEDIHLKVASSFFDHLSLVGDYHTHPHPTLKKLRAEKGWEHSPADRAHIRGWAEKARAPIVGGDPRFSLIAAVARGDKSGRDVAREAPNRVRFCIGGVFVVLAAYRLLRDGQYNEQVLLRCPGIPE